MDVNRFFLLSLFFLLSMLQPFSLSGVDWEYRLQARLENQGFCGRYLVNRGNTRILGLAAVDSDGEIDCRAGLSAPFFMAGPIQLEGALREIDSAGILTPGTEVFRESPALSMYISPGSVSTYGVAAGDLALGRYCYLVTLGDNGYRGGGCFSFFPGPYITVHFLHQVSWGYNVSEDSAWLTEHPYPGAGVLYHSWCVFKLNTDLLTIGCTSTISGGRYVPGGYYFRLSGTGNLQWFSFLGYVTVKTPLFIAPSGNYPDDYLTMAGEAVFFPEAAGTLSFRYCRQVEHPSLFPALYFESEEQFYIEAKLTAWILTIKASWEREIAVFKWGDFTVTDKYGAKATADIKIVKCTLLGGYTRDTEEKSVISAGGDLTFRMKRHRVTLSTDCEVDDGLCMDSSVKAVFQLYNGTVTTSLSISDMVFKEGEQAEIPIPSFSLEWKTIRKQ